MPDESNITPNGEQDNMTFRDRIIQDDIIGEQNKDFDIKSIKEFAIKKHYTAVASWPPAKETLWQKIKRIFKKA